MDFQTLRGAIWARCGVDSSDQRASLPILDQIVNEAVQQIALEAPNGWPWYFAEITWSMTSGQYLYGLNSEVSGAVDVAHLASVQVLPAGSTEYQTLGRLSRREQRARYTVTTPGLPECWSVTGDSLWIAPTPDDDYTARSEISFVEPELASDGDEPFLPARFHGAIVALGASLLYERFHNMTDAAAQRASYTAWVKRMKAAAKSYRGPGRVSEVNETVYGLSGW